MNAMSILTVVVTVAILGFLYWRMIKREVPERIGAFQALLPIALGVVSMFPSAFCGVTYMKYVMVPIAASQGAGAVYAGYFTILKNACFSAGLPEEVFKLIMIVIVLLVLRSRVKNVYEYVMIGAAVGFGFTIAEEFYYAESGDVMTFVMRMISVAGHMMFNMIMGEFLGRARFARLNGTGSPVLLYVLALLVPVALHSLFDSCVGGLVGPVLGTLPGMIRGLVAFVSMLVLQLFVLIRFKKKTAEFCGMTVKV